MKKLIFCLFFLFPVLLCDAQEPTITISGNMMDDRGQSMPGVAIFDKHRQKGTASDINGNFTLTLSSGHTHTIIISFVGYRNAEIEVRQSETWSVIFHDTFFDIHRSGSRLVAPGTIELTHKLKSENDGQGVLYMKDNMPESYRSVPLSRIKNIKPSARGYSITEAKGKNYTSGMRLNYTTFVDISTIGRLPETQSQYDRIYEPPSRHWVGYEHFSWGTSIAELRNQGMGIKTYSPKDFFRTGVSFGNTFNVKFSGLGGGYTDIGLMQQKNNSPIPNAYKEAYNASLALRDIQIGKVKSDIGIYYSNAYGRLTEQGSNIATIMHAVFTTPPTFDNLNGLSGKDKGAWIYPDGSYRSYNPQYVDNPYALVNELPDREKNQYLMAFLKTGYQSGRIKWQNNFSYDKSRDKYKNATLPYLDYLHEGTRKNETENIAYHSGFTWEKNDITLYANYDFKHTKDKVNQFNEINSTSYWNSAPLDESLIRNTHTIKYGIKLDFAPIDIEVANVHYFSNTAQSGSYLNLFPQVGFNLKLDKLFDWYYSNLSLFGNIKRSIGETPLISRNFAAFSTDLWAVNFRRFNEHSSAFSSDRVKPETYLKSELGIRYSINDRIKIELSGYNSNTHNMVYPVASFFLTNIGRTHNYGYTLGANYYKHFNNKFKLNLTYSFTQERNKVTALSIDNFSYTNETYLRIGGFKDIAAVFAKGQPMGAIYGTTYIRNDAGQIIIDEDGYPMIDIATSSRLTKIGDPTPDFVMMLNPDFSFWNFNFNFLLEYRHGGDKWNGTKAMMDYYGVSENTAKKRNIKDYVFEGVNRSGAVNRQAVDFYNPSCEPSLNRWMRYGPTGVGEDYIEDASFLRLSSVTLKYTYQLPYYSKKWFESISAGFTARNLLLITSYDGVDPATGMFGYSSNVGLDLFNTPSTRNYSFVVTLNF